MVEKPARGVSAPSVFVLGYGDETQRIVEALAERDSCFKRLIGMFSLNKTDGADTPLASVLKQPYKLPVVLLLAILASIHLLLRVSENKDMLKLLLNRSNTSWILAFNDISD